MLIVARVVDLDQSHSSLFAAPLLWCRAWRGFISNSQYLYIL